MEKILTNDQSETFFNEKYQETYHSKSGAIEESIKKFVEPTKIEQMDNIKILDICFGLGYNSAAAIDKANPNSNIEIIGLENDASIINNIQEVNPNFQAYSIIKQLTPNNTNIKYKNISIKLLLGDARKTIQLLTDEFDIIFLDPFSPKKCPELWSESFFNEIARLSKKGTILTTYSCARLVRENLKKAGFSVKDGPSIGRRAPSTIAYF